MVVVALVGGGVGAGVGGREGVGGRGVVLVIVGAFAGAGGVVVVGVLQHSTSL